MLRVGVRGDRPCMRPALLVLMELGLLPEERASKSLCPGRKEPATVCKSQRPAGVQVLKIYRSTVYCTP